MEMVQCEGGFLGKKRRLKRGLDTWASKRPDDAKAREFKAGWLSRLTGRIVWPGHSWIIQP
jgi:hypothetical protein